MLTSVLARLSCKNPRQFPKIILFYTRSSAVVNNLCDGYNVGLRPSFFVIGVRVYDDDEEIYQCHQYLSTQFLPSVSVQESLQLMLLRKPMVAVTWRKSVPVIGYNWMHVTYCISGLLGKGRSFQESCISVVCGAFHWLQLHKNDSSQRHSSLHGASVWWSGTSV